MTSSCTGCTRMSKQTYLLYLFECHVNLIMTLQTHRYNQTIKPNEINIFQILGILKNKNYIFKYNVDVIKCNITIGILLIPFRSPFLFYDFLC